MKNLSFDLGAMEQAHDLWQWLQRDAAENPSQRFDSARLGDEMARRGMALKSAWRKESPRSIANAIILLSNSGHPSLPLFHPADPDLSDYEAARISTSGINAFQYAQVGDARHLAAYHSGEYQGLLEASVDLPAHYRGFVRGEILATICEKEENAAFNLSRGRGRPLLGYDLKELRRNAVLAHQESFAAGIPWMVEGVSRQLLQLLASGEPVVEDLVQLAKKMVSEGLVAEKEVVIEIVQDIFRRRTYMEEAFELMEWLIENGVPEAARLLSGGFWAGYSTSFSQEKLSREAQELKRHDLIARARELKPDFDKVS